MLRYSFAAAVVPHIHHHYHRIAVFFIWECNKILIFIKKLVSTVCKTILLLISKNYLVYNMLC